MPREQRKCPTRLCRAGTFDFTGGWCHQREELGASVYDEMFASAGLCLQLAGKREAYLVGLASCLVQVVVTVADARLEFVNALLAELLG